jgi:hydroxyacylglutathione hydrolase
VNQPESPHREAPYAIEQLVAHELGNSSYVVADTLSGEAAVIDPVRDADQYVALAHSRGWKLTYALDTHVHNDFLSGGRELSAGGHGTYLRPIEGNLAGAGLIGPRAELALGSLRLCAVHTPGHTPEHVSYLLLDAAGRSVALFSGGALMVGTIARPDLLGADRTYSLAQLALRTVRDVLIPMSDTLPVFPTHGGGSFCGAGQSDERTTTIGAERRRNRLLREADFFDFVSIYANQGEYPAYYRQMARLNRDGVRLLRLPLEPPARLGADAVERLHADGTWLVDVREHEQFDTAFVPDSLSLGVSGPLSAWLGWVMPLDQPVAVIATTEVEADCARRMLIRIGIDSFEGWLPFEDWTASGRAVGRVRVGDMSQLAACIGAGERLAVVDVRQEREWVGGHVPGALHAMPPQLLDAVHDLPNKSVVAVYCSTGYRSALAASMLAREGRLSPWHIVDGIDAWRGLGHPVTVPG